jgi:integrase
MAGYIEDRWLTKRPDPVTGERRRTARYGQGKRYKVAGIPGVRARSFQGKAEALTWKAKAEHESGTGEFIDPRQGEITLARYVDEYWWPARANYLPGTLETMRSRVSHITARFGAERLMYIKTPHLRLFVADLEKRMAPSSVHDIWSYLSSILQAAVEDELIAKNYCKAKTIRLPKMPERKVRPWERDRINTVRAALPSRFRAMVDVGVGAGLRQGEVFGLATEDIDQEAGVLHVRRQVRMIGSKLVYSLPKGGKVRDVPVPPYLVAQLKTHLAAHPAQRVTLPWGNPAEPTTEREAWERAPKTFALVFTGPRGGALRRDTWNQRAWKPALAAARVIPEPSLERRGKGKRLVTIHEEAREHGFHALRHTFASIMLDARETIVAVSRWLGHADGAITLRIYAHMLPEADGRGRDAMQDWFSPPLKDLPSLSPGTALVVPTARSATNSSRTTGLVPSS